MPTTSLPIFAVKDSRVLADDGDVGAAAGVLDRDLHLPDEWLDQLIRFIGEALPVWRDDPARPVRHSETGLTALLCARLAGLARLTPGWDFLQFRREEPDEVDARRSIDIAVAPAGTIIWIKGRAYTEYQTLLPIECKRLPTPVGKDRDAREYLYSAIGSAGGVQRFKAGHHGAGHSRAAMIGYLQEGDIPQWVDEIGRWVDEITSQRIEGWSVTDKLLLGYHDPLERSAFLSSTHARHGDRPSIRLDHMWVEL